MLTKCRIRVAARELGTCCLETKYRRAQRGTVAARPRTPPNIETGRKRGGRLHTGARVVGSRTLQRFTMHGSAGSEPSTNTTDMIEGEPERTLVQAVGASSIANCSKSLCEIPESCLDEDTPCMIGGLLVEPLHIESGWIAERKELFTTVKTLAQFDELVASAPEEQLVVAIFCASWCEACEELHPHWCEIAEKHRDILWLKANIDNCKSLAKRQGVAVLPRVQMFRGEQGQLADFSPLVRFPKKLIQSIDLVNTTPAPAKFKVLGGKLVVEEPPSYVA